MSVSTFIQSDSTSQSAQNYPEIIDADIAVLTRTGDNFAPHAPSSPSMSVSLDPGHLMEGQTLIELASQTTAVITAPTSNPRIDRVVVDNATGLASIVTGTEAASPTPPAIPTGKSPVAQVLLQTTTTSITNSLITDERDFSNFGTEAGGLINIQTFSTSGTYTPTIGTTKVIVELQGGGGSGGGTAATTATTGASSSGGSAGAYAKALITSGFAGVIVTVGQGGAASVAGNNNGNNGSATSFASLVSTPGGRAGNGGAPFSTPVIVGAAGTSAAPAGGNIAGGVGAQGNHGFVMSSTVVVGGTGGSSHFGGGGNGGGNAVGGTATSPGAGGGGSSSIASTAARSGGAGANGIAIIYEYA